MTSTVPEMDAILQVHRDAITAITDITDSFGAGDWDRQTPCDAWTALDLAGHVITAATMWHEALDDANEGITTARWRYTDLPRHNEEYLAALPDVSGPERIEEFVDCATHWCDRVAQADSDLAIPIAVQDVCPTPLTVGSFAWLAGSEFHLHAWDFAQTIGEQYRNPHAQSILDARTTLFETQPGSGDPWEQIIQQSRT